MLSIRIANNKIRLLRALLAGCLLALLTGCGTLSRMELDADDASATRFARPGDLKAEVDALAQSLIERQRFAGVRQGASVSKRK